jgi:hypothetical protein
MSVYYIYYKCGYLLGGDIYWLILNKGLFWLANKITEIQWKIAETIYTPFKMVVFDVFGLYPETITQNLFFRGK